MLACRHGKVEMLVFNLVSFPEASTQFEHSSEVVELMLECCLHLRLVEDSYSSSHPRSVALSSNLATA